MNNPKVVVYTGVFRDYDVLMEPTHTPDNVDFVCFTDEPETARGAWEPRTFEEVESPRDQTARAKMLPHKYFPEYDYSIWVDGNVWVTGNVIDLINEVSVGIMARDHPKRDCTYEEAEVCVENGVADTETAVEQMKRYRTEGFPEMYGLSDVAILVRRHNEPEVRAVMETWWEEFQQGSTRTQLSFDYAIWKHNVDIERFDIDFDDSAYFWQFSHKPSGIFGIIHELRLRALERTERVPSGIERTALLAVYAFASIPAYIRMSQYVLRNEGLSTFLDKAVRKVANVAMGD